jgi:hypothetical protein
MAAVVWLPPDVRASAAGTLLKLAYSKEALPFPACLLMIQAAIRNVS